MSKVFLGVIGVLVLLCSFLYWQNTRLSALNDAFELRDAEQKAAIENLQNDFTLQTNSLLELQSKNQEIEAEMSRYLDIFKRHNLSKLAIAKPGLIETRVNNGTKNVFDSIEKDTAGIDDLDSGLQLQPNSE
jgi:hypothetical protein|tara:strand:+ start:737 stop:1132 length:396 start_codon:yes stop_codon:yes gene_type:complete